MPQTYNPAGFWRDFPWVEVFEVDFGKKTKVIEVERLTVLSDRKSVTLKYGGQASNVADNKIQLPRDAQFLRDIAAEFILLADQFDAARR